MHRNTNIHKGLAGGNTLHSVSHTNHSAYARVTHDAGLCHAVFGGAMREKTFVELRTRVSQTLGAKKVGISDVRAVAALWDAWEEDAPASVSPTPWAILARPDQAPLWIAYARIRAQAGVMRPVFLDVDEAMVWSWHQLGY